MHKVDSRVTEMSEDYKNRYVDYIDQKNYIWVFGRYMLANYSTGATGLVITQDEAIERFGYLRLIEAIEFNGAIIGTEEHPYVTEQELEDLKIQRGQAFKAYKLPSSNG